MQQPVFARSLSTYSLSPYSLSLSEWAVWWGVVRGEQAGGMSWIMQIGTHWQRSTSTLRCVFSSLLCFSLFSSTLLSPLHIAPVRRESTNLHSHATVYAASRSKLISTRNTQARLSLLWELNINCGPENVGCCLCGLCVACMFSMCVRACVHACLPFCLCGCVCDSGPG